MILNNVTSISEELPFCEVKLKIYSEESVCKKTNKKQQQHKSKIHNSFTKATTTNKSLESHQNALACLWMICLTTFYILEYLSHDFLHSAAGHHTMSPPI